MSKMYSLCVLTFYCLVTFAQSSPFYHQPLTEDSSGKLGGRSVISRNEKLHTEPRNIEGKIQINNEEREIGNFKVKNKRLTTMNNDERRYEVYEDRNHDRARKRHFSVSLTCSIMEAPDSMGGQYSGRDRMGGRRNQMNNRDAGVFMSCRVNDDVHSSRHIGNQRPGFPDRRPNGRRDYPDNPWGDDESDETTFMEDISRQYGDDDYIVD